MTEPIAFAVAAFAGGAFGAAIGALNAFAFTGFLVVAGETVNIVQRNLGASYVDITHDIGFGVVLGPHVAFAGGAGAAAYAAKKGYLDGDGYHPAKNIVTGLGTRPDVLAVGGVFGAVGYVFAEASTAVSAPYDPVAAGVVVSALAHRAALGYSVVGDASLRARGSAETWLPYQNTVAGASLLGVSVGVLGGYLAYATGSAFLGFGISAATLALMCAGTERIPVTHHITLPASTAVIALTGASAGVVPVREVQAVGLAEALAVGGGFGVLGAVLGEFAQRLTYAGAETHLDPPAASIVLTTFVIVVLAAVGVLPSTAWVPTPV